MIHFEEITNQNVAAVLSLSVSEDQKSFVADNAVSLAEAYATRNEGNFALPRAIYDGETLVGFLMLGYGTLGDASEPELFRDNFLLWRLMFDKKFQGKGYARPVLDEAVRLVRNCGKRDAKYLLVSYEPENLHGRNVYLRYGFQETGLYCGNEIVAKLEL